MPLLFKKVPQYVGNQFMNKQLGRRKGIWGSALKGRQIIAQGNAL
jgi:hypothetical protein